MEFTIRIADIGWFILFVLGAAALVYLIIFLRNAGRLAKEASRLLEKNSSQIDESLSLMPEVVENVHHITETVRDGVNRAETAIDTIGGTLTEAASTVGSGIDHLMVFTNILREVIQIIMEFIPSKRKS